MTIKTRIVALLLGVFLAAPVSLLAQVVNPQNFMRAGTAAAPGLPVLADPDTGIYSPGANQWGVSTAGTSRFTFDASGNAAFDTNVLYVDATNNRVGVRDSAPSALFGLKTSATPGSYTLANGGIVLRNDAGTEVMRIWGTDPDVAANYNSGNTYVGKEAGLNQATDNVSAGYLNTGVGYEVMQGITTGYENAGFGNRALRGTTTGYENFGGGAGALIGNTTGFQNMGLGRLSLGGNTIGSGNVGVGTKAGYTATPANANVSGNNNVWIGTESGPGTTTQLSNAIAIGYQALNTASNEVVLGNSSITSTVLRGGVTIPANLTVDTSTLHVDSASNRVGIGTATPGVGALEVKAASGNVIANFTNNVDADLQIRSATSVLTLGTNAASAVLALQAAGTERARIAADGSFLIGTTTDDTELLKVAGAAEVTGVLTLGAGAILDTPASVTLTNATGLPISTGVSGLGTGVATFLGTPSSANLAAAVTGETGTGALVFGTDPTFSGTPLVTNMRVDGGSIYWTSRSAITSPADGIFQITNQAGTDFSRLQFGGTTSSFPALKRNGGHLHLRLADDSAYSDLYLRAMMVDTAGGITNAELLETGIDRASGSAETFNIQNSGAGAMTLQVDGVAVPTISSTDTLTNKTLTTPVITLEQGTAPSNTAEGRIQWDTDDNVLVVGDGAATKTFRGIFTGTSDASYNPASLAAASSRCDSVTVTGVTAAGGVVSFEPGAVTPFANGCVVTSTRATADNTVEICWGNTIDAVTACDVGDSTWTFSQPQ